MRQSGRNSANSNNKLDCLLDSEPLNNYYYQNIAQPQFNCEQTTNSEYLFEGHFQQQIVAQADTTHMLTDSKEQRTLSVSSSDSSCASSSSDNISLKEEKVMSYNNQEVIKTSTTPISKMSNPLNSLSQMAIKIENSSSTIKRGNPYYQ